MSTCKSCGAKIVWIRMKETGNSMPCDEGMIPYKKDPKGLDVLVSQKGEIIRCRLDFEGKPDGMARRSHFASCTKSAKYRRRP